MKAKFLVTLALIALVLSMLWVLTYRKPKASVYYNSTTKTLYVTATPAQHRIVAKYLKALEIHPDTR